MKPCATIGCTKPAANKDRYCPRCRSRNHRNSSEREDEQLREDRALLAAWNAHVATSPRPARNPTSWRR